MKRVRVIEGEKATVSPLPRIGIVLPDLAGGGAERIVLTLAGALLERGYPVDLILQRLSGSYRRLIPDGIRIYYRRRKRTTDLDLLAHCRERRIEMRPLAVSLMATCSAWLFLQRLRIGCPLNLGRIRAASAIARYLREAPPQLLFAQSAERQLRSNTWRGIGKSLHSHHSVCS